MYSLFCVQAETPAAILKWPCGPMVNSGLSPILTLNLPLPTEQLRILSDMGVNDNFVPELITSTRKSRSLETWVDLPDVKYAFDSARSVVRGQYD
jgi:hypothetical protein